MSRFTLLMLLRIALLIGNVLLFVWIFGDMRLLFNQIILVALFIGQLAELIYFINHTNRELARLFISIKHSDFTVSFNRKKLGHSFSELEGSLNEIVQAFKQVKIEKEAQFHFLQMLVNQLTIGIISLQKDEIVLINPTAQKLLCMEGAKNWKLLEVAKPAFTKEIELIGNTGRKLIEWKENGTTKLLAIEVNTLIILDKQHRLITLQDINSEIEQKEIEAWHKLIRILTHEIMNSVTPISSLTETMQGMLTDKNGKQKDLSSINDETITDVRFSLNTIQKRSEGLFDFVENYRKLTRVPKPVKEKIRVHSFLLSMEGLMKQQLIQHQIQLSVSANDKELVIDADQTLLEQVIINLITNSIHALENRSNKEIKLKAYTQENFKIIEVTDNGKGIPEKELKEIFIPFFSTRQEGSGIGLSLSKQIMSAHEGSIRVKSEVGIGTSFYLYFKV
jgi:two-component system, NtrC family, nitrogen regulation sensor histidine kinase NtrY